MGKVSRTTHNPAQGEVAAEALSAIQPGSFGSLFSGIGGLDLGLERAGWNCKWQVENNDYCQRILARHWPDAARYSDIREVDFEEVEKVELIAGGFPCQPVSQAGSRLAQDDPRWLWPQFARAIRVLRPRFVLVENVPGLLVRGFGDVLGDLATLGYDAEWEEFPAAAVGAPHLRYRVFIVAYAPRAREGRVSVRQGKQAEQTPYALGSGAPLPDTDRNRQRGRTHQQKQISERSAEALARAHGPHGTSAHADDRRRAPAEDIPQSERVVFSRAEFDRICALLRAEWPAEPDVVRVVHGVPDRVDRIEGLGNAVVPAQAQLVGELLRHFAESTR